MSSYSTETFRKADQGAHEDAESISSGSSIALIVPTLLKNMIGAGIFSLPVGLRHASPIPGLIILGIIGILSASSYWMIGYCCISCSVKSFRDLWNMVLGPKSAWIIDVTIFLNGWITLICYIILIGDFTTKSFEGLLGADHVLAQNRALNQTVITALVLLPLSLAKDLQRLAYTSILGLAVLVYVLFVVIHDSILNSPPEISQDVPLCQWNFGIFEAIALYCHAFVAHYNAPKVFSELANPTLSRWTMLVGIAYSVAFVVYAEFAWAGFRRFEWAVEGNVLKNYGPQLNILIAWLGMGFSIAFTYPLVFNSAREAAINLTLMARRQMSSIPLLHQVMSSPRFQHLQRGHSGSSWQRRSAQLIGLLGPSPDSPNHKLSRKPGTKTTVLLVFCTYVVGVRCTDVGVVNALAGSIMGCMVCLVLPGLLFFKTARMQRRSREVQKSRGLNEVLLPKGLSILTSSPMKLLVAQFAGLLIFLSGLVFTVVGTAVILLHHQN